MKTDTTPQPTLADQFIADLGRYPSWFKLKGKSREVAERIASQYRIEMRKARRFVLDDDFTRYSSEVSTNTRAEKLLYRLQYATLPYEHTWIEFDSRVKMRVIRAIHRPGEDFKDEHEIPQRMGMLIHRLDTTKWICTIVSQGLFDGEPTVPNLIAYLVSTEEHDFTRDRTYDGCEAFAPGVNTEVVLKQAGQHISNLGKAMLWGYGIDSAVLDAKAARTTWPITPSFLERHGDPALSRSFQMFFSRAGAVEGGRHKLADVVGIEMREFTGFIRWLVTVLAMLNEVPLRARHVEGEGQYVTRMGSRKRLDYHALTLRVPKTRPVEYIQRKLSNREAQKRRAHEVRSHWRTYLVDDPCRREEHEWEYDYVEGYRLCGRCMSASTLIPEHVRGDPKLGWSEKHYVIEKARGATA